MSTLDLLQKSKSKKADQDQILDIAHELENLTKEKAESLATELLDADNFNAFRLGGVLSVIKANGWFEGYKDYKDYVSKMFGIEYRKAQYWINIYDKLVGEQISWAKVKNLGWTKISILVPVLTNANVDEWVSKAEAVNCETLKAIVKAALSTAEEAEESAPITTEVTTMAFKVHADQKDNIRAALDKAKGELNTDFDTVALEGICTGYLGNAVAAAKSVKTMMKEAGYMQVLTLFEEIWPEVNLSVSGVEEAVA